MGVKTPEQRETNQRTNRRKYEVQRTLALILMGARCSYCPETRVWLLEFHHTERTDWRPAKTSRHRRIKLYLRDWGKGICVLACGKCNKEKGQPKESKEHPDEPIPF